MNTTTARSFAIPREAPTAARALFKLLGRLQHGSLSVQLPDGSMRHFGPQAPSQAPAARMTLRNWNVCSATLRSGDIGFAETYIAGDWTTPHLSDLLRLFIRNRQHIEDAIYGTWTGRLLYRIRHLLHRNTRTNSQKNIHAHYDLGNAFYELWLDDTMNYSSAWFDGDLDRPMRDAQHAKVRRALRMSGVQPGDRVLEIGCGWGALAEMATTEFGATLTGVTLSTEQLAFAQARMEKLGVHSDLRLQDYRDIDDGPYDAICSIEMVEAVGREYWPTYFNSLQRLLKPGGKACVQSIVIDDALFARYIQSTDFIQQYIFPGGCLPCPSEFRRAARDAGLEVVDEFAFGADYAETLRRWREKFLAERERVLQLGFDARFIRIWEFYLGYCEAAFDMANIDLVQFTLRRPE
ncbi:MAG: cyclopropane-fatty-acyl-phospholipid synthase family protein [Burkholderiales bacterium]|nr:cyclopropane-fatty-acyl-phospholipid synthase family protein [Burkholderiales bacterium]